MMLRAVVVRGEEGSKTKIDLKECRVVVVKVKL